MLQQLRVATVMLIVLTVLTGFVYPLAITIAAQGLFHHQADGSLIVHDGRTLGSELIGQPFDDPKYFWGRPSATGPFPYNAASSSGSNYGIGHPDQLKAIAGRVEKLRQADPGNHTPVPADLVTASGSGLDPHISPAAARYQLGRVSRARNIDPTKVEEVIQRCTLPRQWGILGDPRVNVLKLNLLLDHPEWREVPHSWKDAL